MTAAVVSMWVTTGEWEGRPGPDAPGRDGRMAFRMSANSAGGAAPATWAAAVAPAEVPIVRSAVVTSSPASNRPARTPISQALPVDPPPPRTSAVRVSWCEEVVIVAF